MKEHPIIFSTDMVKAILDGRKTQTRRVIKPQPACHCGKPDFHGQTIDWIGYKYEGREGWFCYTCGNGLKHIDEWSAHGFLCPYGQVGDRLWVREAHTWITLAEKDPWKTRAIADGSFKRTDSGEPVKMCYKADGYEIPAPWRPSIFMPRWASRITLEITELRAEKLQEISLQDIKAEGVWTWEDPWKGKGLSKSQCRMRFARLWDSLNAKRGYSWESNPWVWVISFIANKLSEKSEVVYLPR